MHSRIPRCGRTRSIEAHPALVACMRGAASAAGVSRVGQLLACIAAVATTDDVIMDAKQRQGATAAAAAAAAAALRARLAAVVAAPAAVPALAALAERAAAAAELAASQSGALGPSSSAAQLPTPGSSAGAVGGGSGVLGPSALTAGVATPRPSTASAVAPASGRQSTVAAPLVLPATVTLLHVASALIATLVPMRRDDGAMWAAAFLERTLRGFQLTPQGTCGTGLRAVVAICGGELT